MDGNVRATRKFPFATASICKRAAKLASRPLSVTKKCERCSSEYPVCARGLKLHRRSFFLRQILVLRNFHRPWLRLNVRFLRRNIWLLFNRFGCHDRLHIDQAPETGDSSVSSEAGDDGFLVIARNRRVRPEMAGPITTSATTQSILRRSKTGLLRFARNDEVRHSEVAADLPPSSFEGRVSGPRRMRSPAYWPSPQPKSACPIRILRSKSH